MTFIPAKKHLGQNFLIDPKVIDRIIKACQLKNQETILEIGPGQGALTTRLLEQGQEVIAVEKDPRMVNLLKEKLHAQKNAHIIEQDFLKFDLATLPEKTKVIGNLPYNISTPIIEKFLTEKHSCPELFFTVQLEFGERLAAQPGGKDYGALTCFVQFFTNVEILFKIPATCFRPVPKVTSCFLRITFREPKAQDIDTDRLFALIRQAFQQRRKKIRNALAPMLGQTLADILQKTGIDENLRPENLTLKDYIEIVRTMGWLAKGRCQK